MKAVQALHATPNTFEIDGVTYPWMYIHGNAYIVVRDLSLIEKFDKETQLFIQYELSGHEVIDADKVYFLRPSLYKMLGRFSNEIGGYVLSTVTNELAVLIDVDLEKLYHDNGDDTMPKAAIDIRLESDKPKHIKSLFVNGTVYWYAEFSNGNRVYAIPTLAQMASAKSNILQLNYVELNEVHFLCLEDFDDRFEPDISIVGHVYSCYDRQINGPYIKTPIYALTVLDEDIQVVNELYAVAKESATAKALQGVTADTRRHVHISKLKIGDRVYRYIDDFSGPDRLTFVGLANFDDFNDTVATICKHFCNVYTRDIFFVNVDEYKKSISENGALLCMAYRRPTDNPRERAVCIWQDDSHAEDIRLLCQAVAAFGYTEYLPVDSTVTLPDETKLVVAETFEHAMTVFARCKGDPIRVLCLKDFKKDIDDDVFGWIYIGDQRGNRRVPWRYSNTKPEVIEAIEAAYTKFKNTAA